LSRPTRFGLNSAAARHRGQRETTEMSTILIVILVLLLLGALPTWGYSSGWGYWPSGGLGLVLLILVVLLLMGRI
jgi:drug/metabolite transporter (DMT)-like permease